MTRDEWVAHAGAATDDAVTVPLLGTSPLKIAEHAYGVVAVSGADALVFLHAQMCGDCSALGPGQTLLTGWCSPQGRVLFLPRLVAGAEAVYALLPTTQVDSFVERLRRYVLRARVAIDDLRTSHGVTLLCTPGPGTLRLAYVADGTSTNASSADGGRHWLVAPYAELAAAWDAVAARPASATVAALAAIRAGEVPLADALADTFLPQELELERHGGVSFDKGCYPGQEIVARVRFRGKVKRGPRRLLAAGPAPAPNTRVLDAGGAAIGTVLLAAALAPGRSELLAVIDTDGVPATLADGVHLDPAG